MENLCIISGYWFIKKFLRSTLSLVPLLLENFWWNISNLNVSHGSSKWLVCSKMRTAFIVRLKPFCVVFNGVRSITRFTCNLLLSLEDSLWPYIIWENALCISFHICKRSISKTILNNSIKYIVHNTSKSPVILVV